jgi:hypothetical protein
LPSRCGLVGRSTYARGQIIGDQDGPCCSFVSPIIVVNDYINQSINQVVFRFESFTALRLRVVREDDSSITLLILIYHGIAQSGIKFTWVHSML